MSDTCHTDLVSTPSAAAFRAAQTQENPVCANTDSLAHVAKASDVVSPAISQAVSPSTGENYTTEPDGSQSCNQSGGESSPKPNCYKCKHRRGLVWDAHSQCFHPRISDVDRYLAPLAQLQGLRAGVHKRLNISGDAHGIRNGWFMWPMNFDPAWLRTCDGFELLTDETANEVTR